MIKRFGIGLIVLMGTIGASSSAELTVPTKQHHTDIPSKAVPSAQLKAGSVKIDPDSVHNVHDTETTANAPDLRPRDE